MREEKFNHKKAQGAYLSELFPKDQKKSGLNIAIADPQDESQTNFFPKLSPFPMIKRNGINKILLPIIFAFSSILIAGFFTLDISHSSNVSTSIVLIFFHFAGIYWSMRETNSWQTFFLTSAGLIFYSIILFLFQSTRFWHFPPFFCLIGFSIGFWIIKIRYPILILWIVFACYYSFIGYTQLEMAYNKASSSSTSNTNLSQIRLLDSLGTNKTTELKSRIILLETWNQYCGACFQAMKDLHPFFQKMEESHPSFSHFYVYQGRRIPNGDTIATIFRNDRIPFSDQNILWDPERKLLDLPKATGLPQFIFLDSSLNILHFSEGYRPSFRYGYKRKFRTLIGQYAQ